jgi:hypothetical protein
LLSRNLFGEENSWPGSWIGMWFAAKLIGLDVGAGVWLIRKVDSKEVGLFRLV